MSKPYRFWSLVFIAVLATYGCHLLFNYFQLQKQIRLQASYNLTATVDAQSVSEIGYIYEMRRETNVSDSRFELVWFIAVPATNQRYPCTYEAGYQGFVKGDGVRLIHKRDHLDPDDAYDFSGWIVGLHDKEKGRVTAVVAINEDDIDY